MKTLLLAILALALNACGFYVVDPGTRGVKVTLGEVSEKPLPEGFGLKLPLVTTVTEVSVKQNTAEVKADCFSSNQQQIIVTLNVMYKIPEASVVKIFREYNGDPLDTLITPRLLEHVKQATSLHTVDDIMKNRDVIKAKTLDAVRKDLGTLIVIEDITIKNVSLSAQLMHAIEEKMVQEQEAAKAQFTKQKSQVEAETAIITAEGAAKALSIQGEAIRKNPETMQMELIKKWNGVSPLVVGDAKGPNIILPIANKHQ